MEAKKEKTQSNKSIFPDDAMYLVRVHAQLYLTIYAKMRRLEKKKSLLEKELSDGFIPHNREFREMLLKYAHH